VTLKNPTPESRTAFENIGKTFAEVTGGKWTYGWTREDSNKAIVLGAWDSVEVSSQEHIIDAYSETSSSSEGQTCFL
jgi:hypothetical protein